MSRIIQLGTEADAVSRVYSAKALVGLTEEREWQRAVVQVATVRSGGAYRVDLEHTLFYADSPWQMIGVLAAALADTGTAVALAADADPEPSLSGFVWTRVRFGSPAEGGETAEVSAVAGPRALTVVRGDGARAHAAGEEVWLNTPESEAVWQPVAEFDSSKADERNRPTLVDMAGGHFRFRRLAAGDPVMVAVA